MINNKILEFMYEPNNAIDFMEECPLTQGGLKKLFLNEDFLIKGYEEYLYEIEGKDVEANLFNFLNSSGNWSDEEVIEEILESLEEEYYIDFVDERGINDSYWRIYKINKNEN